MEYITTKEASEKWGISAIRITVLANKGRIPGAKRMGRIWMIPAGVTKPPARNAGHPVLDVNEAEDFSFPLYHFRPDWSDSKKTQLSGQQRGLLEAETAVLECRFADAWTILESILQAPDDIATEIGCLWSMGVCSAVLNKPRDFSGSLLRLQMLLSGDFPHRKDYVIILDFLKTYVDSLGSTANNPLCSPDVHYQSLPMTCMMVGYVEGAKEAMKPGSADTNLLELNLCLLKTTGALIVMEMMHCYLMGIYYMRQNMEAVERHGEAAVRIAYENKFYFPLITYYRYFAPVLSVILARYPEAFQDRCRELISRYEINFTRFLSAINKYTIFTKLTDCDYLYAVDVLSGLSNTDIAKKMGVSPQTVSRRLEKVCEKLGVATKKELIEYLKNYT